MKQDSRWSETQLATLKGALADNDIAVTAIRKVFLEDELTDQEAKILKSSIQDKPEVQELLRRHYMPQLVVDAPIGQVQDRLAGIPVNDMTPELATLHAAATERAEQCMASHLDELCTGVPGQSFKKLYKLSMKDPVETFVGLLARNKYIVDAEKLTYHLHLLAGRKEETPEETMTRLRKDSAK